MEESTGKILYSKNANSIMYPASTTKIMTAILTLEKCNLSDTAVVSHNAVFSIPSGYSTASLVEGEVLTIEQLLNVLLIPSANDAAVVLAEHIAGSVEAFSDMMNSKAVELGCLNTHFVNPNGIHNENHYSTAYDLALIGKYAMQFPTFKEISSKTRYTLPITNAYSKEDRIFNTTNDLIKPNYSSSPTNYYYKYATGGKTGYTDPAGQCIVATATKDNVSLIAVTLHGDFTEDNLSQRALDCKALFEYGFNNFSMVSIAKKGDVASNMKVPNATKDSSSLDLLYSDDIYAFVPNGFDTSSVTPNIKLSSTFAPIAQDTILGTISYDIDGSNYSCNLLASHEVYKNQFTKTAMELALLLIFLILLSKFLKRKKRRKNYRKKPKK
jgi:serine-type D-ala-D-ala carboxypeptidase